MIDAPRKFHLRHLKGSNCEIPASYGLRGIRGHLRCLWRDTATSGVAVAVRTYYNDLHNQFCLSIREEGHLRQVLQARKRLGLKHHA